MPNKYPEELDQLDSFYQDQLGNVEVLPPADMWDRISASREKDRNKKGFGFPFSNNQKNIGIVILLVLIGVSSAVYFLNNDSEPGTKNSVPVINTPTDNSTAPENESTDTEQPINKTTKENIRSKKTSDAKTVEYNTTENNSSLEEVKTEVYQIQPKIEVVDIVPVEKQEEPAEKAPKKKVSFKEKYKKEYQDSTRNLFVPDKK